MTGTYVELKHIHFSNKKDGPETRLFRNYKACKLLGLTFAAGAEERGLFGRYNRIFLGGRVDFNPIEIFFRDRHIGKNRFDRAFRQTRVAIDAGVGID